MIELFKKYRPSTLDQIVGQDTVVKTVQNLIDQKKIPHTMLFSGPSGCGKTTIARALLPHLNCSDNDVYEINCADFRGIDKVRSIRESMSLAPMGGDTRVWILDECHNLTKDAQTAFLKILEDTPNHVYFFLATTDPQKLLKTIITRSTEFKLSSVKNKDMRKLIISICKKEKRKIEEEVIDEIVESCDGSPRKALVFLHTVLGHKDTASQIEAIHKTDSKKQSIELARKLLDTRSKFSDCVAILKEIEDEPETVRRMILGYMSSVMLGNNKKMIDRAYYIVTCFSENFYDTGKAGLISCTYEVYNNG